MFAHLFVVFVCESPAAVTSCRHKLRMGRFVWPTVSEDFVMSVGACSRLGDGEEEARAGVTSASANQTPLLEFPQLP